MTRPERCLSHAIPSAEDRARELASLVPLWPSELADATLDGHYRLLAKLKRALRAERRRGLAGHSSYDLARHARLLAAYRAEKERFRASHLLPEGPRQQRINRGID